MMRNALVLLVILSLGCGSGRSKMKEPYLPAPDASDGPELADASPVPDGVSHDVSPPRTDSPPGPDVQPPQSDVLSQPDGWPLDVLDVARDFRPADLLPEGPSPRDPPDARRDGPPPVTPDAQPDGPPVSPDGPPPVSPDGPPPVSPDGPPDGLPPVMPDVLPDGLLPPPDTRPDRRPPRPDTRPLPPECESGAACTEDCTVPCQVIGTVSCTCMDGLLDCSECQVPPITVSPEPCPDDPRGTECAQNGLACLVTSNGSLSGACLCMARGSADVLRWSCFLR